MILIITFFIICLNVKTQIYAKYTISHNFDIANIELDRTKPTIQIIKEETTNIQNNKYANNKDEIILIAEIKERNIEKEAIDKSKITVKVENKTINPNIEIKKVEENKNTGKYQIKITNIQENGKLKIEFKEGTVTDTAKWKSAYYSYEPEITIKNTETDITQIKTWINTLKKEEKI